MGSRRVERVAKAIKEEVSKIIQQDVRDPRIGFVTVTGVALSDDLRYAKVYFSIYGDDAEVESTLEGLNHVAGFIRKEIAKRIRLRYTPELVFKYDDSIERSTHLFRLMEEIRNPIENKQFDNEQGI